jgi:hypothetical protein
MPVAVASPVPELPDDMAMQPTALAREAANKMARERPEERKERQRIVKSSREARKAPSA